ncbi:hypothetical protein PT974_10422 [Cladobotryum mycophilum]|uniref:DUF7730 domain-containing protein n=1 Tax=Cladobotryum mycophilum TaxID=491253 RepID=A0ABR0SAV2_9HYPO
MEDTFTSQPPDYNGRSNTESHHSPSSHISDSNAVQSRPPARSRCGNKLFQCLPVEIRCIIWEYVLFSNGNTITPSRRLYSCYSEERVPIEARFSPPLDRFNSKGKSIKHLNAILQTCRLFWLDQETHMLFYKHHTFEFGHGRDFANYILAITPRKRQAIRHLVFAEHFKADCWNRDPRLDVSDYTAVLRLCTGLRTFKHRFFPSCNPLSGDWVEEISEFLVALITSCPSLICVYIRKFYSYRCYMSVDRFDIRWTNRHEGRNVVMRQVKKGKETLRDVWDLFHRLKQSRPSLLNHLPSRRGIARTLGKLVLHTLGESRGHESAMVSSRTRARRNGAKTFDLERIPAVATDEHCDVVLQQANSSEWMTSEEVFTPRLKEVVSQRHVAEIYKILAWQYHNAAVDGHTAHPDHVLPLIRDLPWSNRRQKRRVLERFAQLGKRFDEKERSHV